MQLYSLTLLCHISALSADLSARKLTLRWEEEIFFGSTRVQLSQPPVSFLNFFFSRNLLLAEMEVSFPQSLFARVSRAHLTVHHNNLIHRERDAKLSLSRPQSISHMRNIYQLGGWMKAGRGIIKRTGKYGPLQS